MRLFTALDLPDEIVARLDRFIARLKPTARIKWSPASNLHVTTKFIGEWLEQRLTELEAALRSVPSRPPIAVHIHGAGFFPNPKSPRTFWSGIDATGIAELAVDTDAATAALGIEREKRAYSPHLTLARIKERLDLSYLHRAIACESSLDFGRFEARSFYLYRSQLRPTGSVYTKLSEFPLTHS
jgi:RNA 2',3'-cyclic 3'-phosphodiesterase